MGGSSGGGSSGYRLGDSRSLEEKAKKILLSGEGKKHVFISFAHEDLNEVNLLRGQAVNDNSDIDFKDFSVKEPYDSERAEYIKSKISERINRVSTTVVYLSDATPNSHWVKWEVEKSLQLGKKVVAVHKGDSPPLLPSWVGKHRIKVVKWSNLAGEI